MLPIGILAVVPISLVAPRTGEAFITAEVFGVAVVKWLIVALFFMTGLRFDAAVAKRTWKAMHSVLVAIPLNLIMGPVLAVTLGWALRLGEGSLEPYLVGMLLIGCVPPTMSSGIVLTGVAHGNTMLAAVLTIVTNLVGILLLPTSLAICLRLGTSFGIDPWKLFLDMGITILLPFCLAMILRPWLTWLGKRVGSFYPNLVVISLVWGAASKGQQQIIETPLDIFARLALFVLLAHGSLMVMTWMAGRGLKLPRYERKAIVFVASQKSMATSLPLLLLLSEQGQLTEAVAATAAVSCILFHLIQILVDSVVATLWKARGFACARETHPHVNA